VTPETEEAPEVVVVPVKRFDVNITLDDMLTRMSEQADRFASPESGEDLAPEIVERLRRLSAVAGELRSELRQIEPSVLNRLAQRRATSG
jgi:hypothetical protein